MSRTAVLVVVVVGLKLPRLRPVSAFVSVRTVVDVLVSNNLSTAVY